MYAPMYMSVLCWTRVSLIVPLKSVGKDGTCDHSWLLETPEHDTKQLH